MKGDGIKNLEYEADRKIQLLDFEPTDYDLTKESSELDTISWFFTHRRALLATLLISNFQLSVFEIKTYVIDLLDELGLGDDYRKDQLNNSAIINSEAVRTACKADILERTEGKVTRFSDQSHKEIPVYSITTNSVFKSAVIASYLLEKFGSIFEFPLRTEESLDSLFRTQLQLLSLLDKNIPQPLTILDSNFPSENKRKVNKTTLLDLSNNLHQAGFIERIGESIVISKGQFAQTAERTKFKEYIEELIGENTVVRLSYEELRHYLLYKALANNNNKTNEAIITQNISKYLNRLRNEARISVVMTRQKYRDKDLGYFGQSRKYVLTTEGELFLDLIKTLIENPKVILGKSDDFFVHDDTALKGFNDFSPLYQLLVANTLKILFQDLRKFD